MSHDKRRQKIKKTSLQFSLLWKVNVYSNIISLNDEAIFTYIKHYKKARHLFDDTRIKG